MKMQEYPKKIKKQATITVLSIALFFIGVCVAGFTGFGFPVHHAALQMALSICMVLLAIIALIVLQNYSKKQYCIIAQQKILETKVEQYARLLTKLHLITLVIALLISVLSLCLPNISLYGGALLFLILLLHITVLYPNPYTLKLRLQLTDEEMNRIYGNHWKK